MCYTEEQMELAWTGMNGAPFQKDEALNPLNGRPKPNRWDTSERWARFFFTGAFAFADNKFVNAAGNVIKFTCETSAKL